MSPRLPISRCTSRSSRQLRSNAFAALGVAPELPRLGPAALLDQRAIMLDDLARRFGALRVDRALGLVQRRAVVGQAALARVRRFGWRHRVAGVGCGCVGRGSFELGRLHSCDRMQPAQQRDQRSVASSSPPCRNRRRHGSFVSPQQQVNRESFHGRRSRRRGARTHDRGRNGGGGGGGGVLAVVLLIIVVLVLLYHVPRPARPRRQARPTSTFPTRSTSTSTTTDRRGSASGRVASPRPARGRGSIGAAPV